MNILACYQRAGFSLKVPFTNRKSLQPGGTILLLIWLQILSLSFFLIHTHTHTHTHPIYLSKLRNWYQRRKIKRWQTLVNPGLLTPFSPFQGWPDQVHPAGGDRAETTQDLWFQDSFPSTCAPCIVRLCPCQENYRQVARPEGQSHKDPWTFCPNPICGEWFLEES